jgi:hypothetical protein
MIINDLSAFQQPKYLGDWRGAPIVVLKSRRVPAGRKEEKEENTSRKSECPCSGNSGGPVKLQQPTQTLTARAIRYPPTDDDGKCLFICVRFIGGFFFSLHIQQHFKKEGGRRKSSVEDLV